MLVHLRRFSSFVAVVLVGLGFVAWDPNTPHAWAASCVGSSVCSPQNAWVLTELALQARDIGSATNVGGAPASVFNDNLRSTPTTAAPPAAGASRGLKIKGRGWAGAVLALGGSLGLDLLLSGDAGAPDPVDTLPSPDVSPTQPGWTASSAPALFTNAQNGTKVESAISWSLGTEWLFGQADGTATVVLSSPRIGTTRYFSQPRIRWYRQDTATHAVAQYQNQGVTLDAGASQGFTQPLASPGYILDHIVIEVGGIDVGTYYPIGHTSRPPDAVAAEDATHTFVNRVRCEGPNGVSEFVESVVEFTIRQLREGLTFTAPEVACPGDMWAAESKPEVRSDVGGTVTTTPLSDADATAPQTLRDRAQGLQDGTDRGLELEQDGVPCVVGQPACRGWAQDPSKGTRYKCKDNGIEVAINRCLIYDTAFDPVPTTGGSAGTDGSPAPTDPEARQCWPKGWGMANPFEWVYRPIVCAFEWAFVPKTTPVKVQQLTQTITTKSPVPEIVSIATVLDPPEVGSACLVLSLPLGFVIGHDVPLIDTCTHSDPISRLVRDYRPLMGAIVWVTVLSPLAWWAWKQYAPGASGVA